MDIKEQVEKIIVDVKHLIEDIVSLTPDTDLITEFAFTSLQILELSQLISKTFSIDYGADLEDIDGFSCWGTMSKQIQKKISANLG